MSAWDFLSNRHPIWGPHLASRGHFIVIFFFRHITSRRLFDVISPITTGSSSARSSILSFLGPENCCADSVFVLGFLDDYCHHSYQNWVALRKNKIALFFVNSPKNHQQQQLNTANAGSNSTLALIIWPWKVFEFVHFLDVTILENGRNGGGNPKMDLQWITCGKRSVVFWFDLPPKPFRSIGNLFALTLTSYKIAAG